MEKKSSNWSFNNFVKISQDGESKKKTPTKGKNSYRKQIKRVGKQFRVF